MRISLEDRIFEHTGEWIHGNLIAEKVRGDKTAILKKLHNLVETGYLETKKDGNKICYKRKDIVESDEKFQWTFTNITQKNNSYFLEKIKKISKLTTKKNKLAPNAKIILQHIEHLQDQNNTQIVRTTYQRNLGLISERIAHKRIKMLEDERDRFMKKIREKYNKDLKTIQEHFQNHIKELKFKI